MSLFFIKFENCCKDIVLCLFSVGVSRNGFMTKKNENIVT